ncbi:hypothetical protein BXY57_1107 [Thermoflavifilum aggregans]|uniref:Uncharacterized protein n=1 Tax=Thermoflavifilum aggregans TaxID=454188 RepID=A0A2M9CUP0_9BACT|nr:hypothetical protein [Thermoflavifilum aggregans]PJJ75528.1 hypothetical protein BXY57_1107 [Thermoflavifilum aggregans]
MRAFIAIFWLCIYSGATIATAVHLHACEGKWMTIKNMGASHDCHPTHASHHTKDCCKHPKIQLSLTADQLVTSCDTYKFFIQHAVALYHPLIIKYDHYPAYSFHPSVQSSPPLFSRKADQLARYNFFLI